MDRSIDAQLTHIGALETNTQEPSVKEITNVTVEGCSKKSTGYTLASDIKKINSALRLKNVIPASSVRATNALAKDLLVSNASQMSSAKIQWHAQRVPASTTGS